MNRDMLISLLLIVRVSCEWVEIAQQHFKKPIKHLNQYRLTTEITQEKEIYRNHSIIEHQWNREPIDIGIVNKEHQFKISENIARKELTGNMKTISNVGKVDRVQLINTSFKSSPVMLNPEHNRNEINLFEREFDSQYNRTSYNYFGTDHTIHMEATSDTLLDYRKNEHEIKNIPLITNLDSLEDNLNTYGFHRNPEVISQIAEEISTQTGTKPNPDISNEMPKVPTADVLTTLTDNVDIEQMKTDQKVENKGQYDINLEHIKISNKKQKNNGGSPTEKSVTNDEKSNTMEVIIKFVKLVSETISSNTRRGFSSKVRYLEDLKNNLIANIEERIEATWPDDYDKRERRARATEENARGHLEFPSSETTLMSISFLTFAVFLIKLVLQVIQTYKNKTMMVAPLVVATAGRAAINLHRNKYN